MVQRISYDNLETWMKPCLRFNKDHKISWPQPSSEAATGGVL